MTTTMMRDWRTDDDERLAYHTLTPVTSFGRDERCHVSFSSNSIIFSLCFYYASLCFYYASLCFYYAFIMLSLCMLLLCFYYAFLGTRLIKVSFFGDVTYLRTIFQIRGFLCLPVRDPVVGVCGTVVEEFIDFGAGVFCCRCLYCSNGAESHE